MSAAEFLLGGAAILSGLGAIAAVFWPRPLDKTTQGEIKASVSQMAAASNRWRDSRLWQLEGYVNRDIRWHREVIALLEEAQGAGFIPATATIPAAPEIPEPPPYDT